MSGGKSRIYDLCELFCAHKFGTPTLASKIKPNILHSETEYGSHSVGLAGFKWQRESHQ